MKIFPFLLFSVFILICSFSSQAFQKPSENFNKPISRFLASLQTKSEHFCTGVILTNTSVLVAAHCLFDKFGKSLKKKYDLKVVVGLNETFDKTFHTQYLRISEIVVHPEYDQKNSANDIAFVILRDGIREDGLHKKRISLSRYPAAPGSGYVFAGWNSFHRPSMNLNKREFFNEHLTIADKKVCKRIFEDIFTEFMACAKSEDNQFRGPCNKEDAAPLMRFQTLVGFSILGVGCGIKNWPGLFTDVYHHKKWIENLKKEIKMNEKSYLSVLRGRYSAPGHPLAKHIVSIEYIRHPFSNYQFLCEGTIVKANIILTTASCLFDNKTNLPFESNELWVLAGSSNRYRTSQHLETIGVKEIRFHKNYKYPFILHDLAIVLLMKHIKEDNIYKQRISISQDSIREGLECITLVWNKTKQNDFAPEKLAYGELLIPQQKDCGLVSEKVFCVLDPDKYFERTCLNHQGAPLICDNKLVGLIALDYGCGNMKNLSLFTDLLFYKQWIDDNPSSKIKADFKLILFLCYCMIFQ